MTGRPPPRHVPVAGVVGAWIPPEMAEEAARWLRWALDRRPTVIGLDRVPVLAVADLLEGLALRQDLAELGPVSDIGSLDPSAGGMSHTPVVGAREAAELVGKTERTVTGWCVDGKLPGAYRSGGTWMIPMEALRAA